MDEATRKAWENSPFGAVHRKAAEVEARREREAAERRSSWWADALMWMDTGSNDPTERAALASIRDQCPNRIFGEAAAKREARKMFKSRFRGVDWERLEQLQKAGSQVRPSLRAAPVA